MSVKRTFPGGPAARAALSLALAGALAGSLAGCGGGGAAAAGGGQPSSLQQQARPVWLDYARCVRAHGFPAFPDPRVDGQGQASFGTSPQVKQAGQQAQGACGPILDRLPPAVRNGGNAPVTAAQLHEEMLFAACMRQHGLPRWPDPRPDGAFPLSGTPYATMGKTGPVLTALAACRQYETFGGIRAS
jgi:hypothetical protein